MRRLALIPIGIAVGMALAGCPVPTGTDPSPSPYAPLPTISGVKGQRCPKLGQAGRANDGTRLRCSRDKMTGFSVWQPE